MKTTPTRNDPERGTPSQASGAPPFTPGPINESTVRKYFARGENLRLGGNRLFVVTVCLGLLNLVQAASLLAMVPLKTVKVVMMRESEAGRLAPDFNAMKAYVPDQNAIAYFLSEWADNVFDINSSVITQRLNDAGTEVIGDAVDQLRDLVRKENPLGRLHQYPYLRRTFRRLSVNFVSDDTALIRYELTERTGPGATPQRSVWAMTVTFTLVPPQTQEQINRNPAGLYITSFNNVQESSQ